MKGLLTNKKLIWGAVLLILAFVVYSFFFKEDDAGTLISQSRGEASFEAGREVVIILNDLKNVRLNGSIFEDKAFRSLEDFSIPIDPEPQGRTNPFAPIGTDPIPPPPEE